MRVLIDGKIYDSIETPILIQFDENEQQYFNGLHKFVSAPEDSSKEERKKLMAMNI